MKYGDIKLYTGTSCPELASRIATHMGLELCDREIISFPNCIQACVDRIVTPSRRPPRLFTAT